MENDNDLETNSEAQKRKKGVLVHLEESQMSNSAHEVINQMQLYNSYLP